MKELFSTIEIVKEKLNIELNILGILPTLFDPRMKINHLVLEEIREYFKDSVFRTVIHNNVKLCEAPIYRRPINVYAPHSKGTRDYRMLADEVVELVSQKNTDQNVNEAHAAPEQIA
jgi:chromosome partitioning protein